jgi:hypothetical protein
VATALLSTRIGQMTAATPTIKRPLKMLLPRMVPRPISSWPRSLEMIEVASSGIDVPTATTVAPMMNSGMPKATAIPRAPVTMK